ncbi:MAG TPA: hypothetical protein VFJ51_08505, partial [Nitrososphaeraceae archaeon]|nr:hypothetical protein [Nitrososphaeraceae archaeon]
NKDGQEIAKKEAELHTLIIGVLQETIEWFQKEENITKFGYKKFSIAEVSEEYNPDIRKVDDEFLKTNRIELDSIISIVGAEAFWDNVAHRLQLKEIFSPKGFDYSDGEVSMPESKDLYFNELNELNDLFDGYIEDITDKERNNIIDNELAAADKLIEVEPKEKEIKERLRPIVANDRIMKLAAPRLKALTDEITKEIEKENKAAAA